MSRRLIDAAVILALASPLVACARDSAFAQTIRESALRGNYVYAGEGLTASIPWRFNAVLNLKRKGQYDLDIKVKVKGDDDHDVDHGTYRVDGDHLYLNADKHGESHEFLIRGDSLIAETGWKGNLLLKMVGVPEPIFVKR